MCHVLTTRAFLASLALALALTACQQPQATEASADATTLQASVAAPLPPADSYYEVASAVPLPARKPDEASKIHNFYRLSDRILSGAEPDAAGLAELQARGVKTILSVDGKSPDAATAARLGMRYVHIPIRYSEISEEEVLQITKTFRELEGPFFVHCFHGKHRGPAAAALGRLAADGAGREQAIAEMRQWCGTSSKYEGLYASIARVEIPTVATTKSYAFDFPSSHPFKGLRPLMIEMARVSDNLDLFAENAWKPLAAHPDLDARNEAARMLELSRRAADLPDLAMRPQDFHDWTHAQLKGAEALAAALAAGPINAEAATKAWDTTDQSCASCHKSYRNR